MKNGVWAAARYVLTHPWEVFVRRWNWKTALMSGIFRGAAFGAAMLGLAKGNVASGVLVEVGFRTSIGGFWGSLLQAFRSAQPPWLAGLVVAVVLPAGAHTTEYLLFRSAHTGHVKTGMIVSIALSVVSLLVNLALMRRGLLVVGAEGAPLGADLKRLPGLLVDIARQLCSKKVDEPSS